MPSTQPKSARNRTAPLPADRVKHCAYCGRTMEYRPRWAASWAQVRYCSAACRKTKLTPDDTALEAAIIRLLRSRAAAATICPSEASRAVFGEAGLSAQAMQRTRYAANRLVSQGIIVVTQKGRVVEPSTARGPIRLKGARLPSVP